MKKKFIPVVCALIGTAILLTGCGDGSAESESPEVKDPTPPMVITDISSDEVLEHEELEVIKLEADEDSANPYYKRVNTDDGLAYRVKTTDGDILDFPVSETLIYLIGVGEQSYYEKINLVYTTDDGETHEQLQYHIYAAPSAVDNEETDEPAQETDEPVQESEDPIDDQNSFALDPAQSPETPEPAPAQD